MTWNNVLKLAAIYFIWYIIQERAGWWVEIDRRQNVAFIKNFILWIFNSEIPLHVCERAGLYFCIGFYIESQELTHEDSRDRSGLVVWAFGLEFEVQPTDGGRVLACLSVSLAVPLTFSQLVSVSPTVRLFLDLTCSWECVSHRVLHHRRRCPLEVCLSHFYSSCQPDSIAGCMCVRLPRWHMLLKSPLLLPLSFSLTLLLLSVRWRNLSISMEILFVFSRAGWLRQYRNIDIVKNSAPRHPLLKYCGYHKHTKQLLLQNHWNWS